MGQAKKILVAPLGWGLGHATRCVPVIHELLSQGAEVMLASDGYALEFLNKEFPFLSCHVLPAYGVRYFQSNMVWNMALQLPTMMKAVVAEHFALQTLVEQHNIQGIISDSRFGCCHRKIPCVFITHQVFIKTPVPALTPVVNFLNHRFIRQFDACWVPDVETTPSLSGELSHGNFPGKLHFVGALSRMEWYPSPEKYDAIAVLSGPEPQRTRLERIILEQASRLPCRFLVVQGKPPQQAHFFPFENVELVPFMASAQLNDAILSSGFYIGRSGYSTIMDLAILQKPALLIPTPGQTEQEYLAAKLGAEGLFLVQRQHEVNLEVAMQQCNRSSGLQGSFSDKKALTAAVEGFLALV